MLVVLLHSWSFAQDAAVERPKRVFVPKITVSKETTWATEPLDENGFVDYFAVINRRFSAGVTPENNAIVPLYRAIGPRPDRTRQPEEFFRLLQMAVPPDEGPYFVPPRDVWPDSALNAPWKEADHPWLAAWLRSHEVPLSRLVEASERTEAFSPLVNGPDEPLMMVLLPGIQLSRPMARALIARAMMNLGEGSRFDAWRDLIAAHRFGRLIGRGPTGIEGLVGAEIERQAIEAELTWIAEVQPPAKQLALLRRQLERLPSHGSLAEKIDSCERAIYLDSCIRLARRRLTFEEAAQGSPFENAPLPAFAAEALIRDIDWDEVLRSHNVWIDRLLTASRMRSANERRAALHQLNQDLLKLAEVRKQKYAWLVVLGDQPARTRFTADVMVSLFLPNVQHLFQYEGRLLQRNHNLKIALALAAWHSEHDSYPKTLGDLAPKYLDAVPDDYFTDQPLRYELTANGYRFYSLGANGTDDQGRGDDDTPRGDDLAVQMPRPPPNAKR
jgi:hypothetical protein